VTAAQPAAPRPRGRPRSTRAQEVIRDAATRLFAERGFSRTSVRDIAAAAGVDPTIVIRHFGSKDALFLQTMSVDEGFRGLTEGPLEDLGRNLLRRLVAHADPAQAEVFAALIGALDRPEVRNYVEQSTERHIVQPLIERLTGADAELRARLVTAQILGLLVAVWALRRPDLTSTPLDDVLDIYARAVQTLIDGTAGNDDRSPERGST